MFRFLISSPIFVVQKLCNMNELQQITNEMNALEAQLQAFNHKYNYNPDKMPADNYIEYENIQTTWDSLKRKRDALKAKQL